ncbi:hypothetical protein [Chamaesiphon minutus]|nr:hypothetical protein [Chamaesiphon minutus]
MSPKILSLMLSQEVVGWESERVGEWESGWVERIFPLPFPLKPKA